MARVFPSCADREWGHSWKLVAQIPFDPYPVLQSGEIVIDRVFRISLEKRELEKCELADSTRLAAFVYAFKERYRGSIDVEEWDPGWFWRLGVNCFLSEYPGFG